MTDTAIELVVLDMAGTTVLDDGLVTGAFDQVSDRIGLAANSAAGKHARRYVRETMGQSKIAVFRALLRDEERAQQANGWFEEAYAELVAARGVVEVPGAMEAIRSLRESGIKVVLTTGFAPATRDLLLDELGWRKDLDGWLSPVDAGRGRPFPDLPLTALLRTSTSSVSALVVVGDTPSDMGSGQSAGAGQVIGVRTGGFSTAQLLTAGADLVIDSVALLPQALN